MRDGREPFPAKALVGAGLLREALGCARGVEKRPFETVGEEVVLEMDAEGDDTSVGVVGVVKGVGGVGGDEGARSSNFGW